ncbi:pyruvate ferredoxin oxidoreductase [Desulfovibrio sp. OttesenSCG-928-C06]|nr:pyruvate ferredoxin oxidoreductase [Desulfovibrio sp. OttesenSCG-928-C06]
MAKRVMLDGNEAASEALRLARIKVVSAYPVTPQTPISEKLADYVADGSLQAKYIRVESEHTAMAAAIGAQLTGVRAATATSSIGLALMHEICGAAAGLRIPIVMPVVNRSLAAPWSLWCDHQDAMVERDQGWMQLYAENCQEVLDLILIAYRTTEQNDVLLPVMVCLDGFFLSHTTEAIMLPEQAEVDAYLPPYINKNLRLDPDDPMFINALCPTSEFSEMRYQQQIGMKNAMRALPASMAEFAAQFGRSYDLIEAYRTDDAEAVLIGLGTMCGTMKYVVDKYRAAGRKVGMVKILSYRPFPVERLCAALENVPNIGVLDRSAGLGNIGGPVCTDVRAALSTYLPGRSASSFLAGLAGRDITPGTVSRAFDLLLAGEKFSKTFWMDTNTDAALTMRTAPATSAGQKEVL